jgi:itaconyl-CoA hydratase
LCSILPGTVPLSRTHVIYARSEVLEKRESQSHPERGIVHVKTSGFNQDGVTVIEFRRTVMVYKRAYVPHIPQPHEQNGF